MHNLDIILVCMFIFLIDIFSKVFQKNSQCAMWVNEREGEREKGRGSGEGEGGGKMHRNLLYM